MLREQSRLVVLAISISVCFASRTLADDNSPKTPSTTRPAVRISLEHEMQAMDRDYHTVWAQVKDPAKNESTLAAVTDMEQHTLTAKSAAPRSATTMPTTAANAEKLEDYQATMLNVLRQELDLEEQLRANQNDKAADTLDALHQLETEAHAEFRPKRKRD